MTILILGATGMLGHKSHAGIVPSFFSHGYNSR